MKLNDSLLILIVGHLHHETGIRETIPSVFLAFSAKTINCLGVVPLHTCHDGGA